MPKSKNLRLPNNLVIPTGAKSGSPARAIACWGGEAKWRDLQFLHNSVILSEVTAKR
jgi:hypothetical protein